MIIRIAANILAVEVGELLIDVQVVFNISGFMDMGFIPINFHKSFNTKPVRYETLTRQFSPVLLQQVDLPGIF